MVRKALLLLVISLLFSCKNEKQNEFGVFEFYVKENIHKVNNFRIYKSNLDNIYLVPDKMYFNLWEMPIDSMNYVSCGKKYKSKRINLNDKFGKFNLPIRKYDSILDISGTDIYGNRFFYLGQEEHLEFIIENNYVLFLDRKGNISNSE